MNQLLKKAWNKIKNLVERYPVVLAAIAIYLYYLFSSVELFAHRSASRSFVDYVLQFDSLFFMWIAAAALLQVQKMRKSNKQNAERSRDIERVLDRQQIYGQLVNDITMLLQDSVNNPLAVIKVTTQEIRRRFEKDTEILRWLDRIDGAMQRIHNTIRDLQAYEAQKMIEASTTALNEKFNS
jgi:signal transduction histidine kinase